MVSNILGYMELKRLHKVLHKIGVGWLNEGIKFEKTLRAIVLSYKSGVD